MADLWMPGATRYNGRGRSFAGTAGKFANWHSTENDPSATADALARYLISMHYEPHIVWNPWTGEIAQLLPANTAGSVLKSGNVNGSVNIGIEAIGRAGVVGMRPFYDSPMKNFDKIMSWLRSWGIPDAWPAGAPLSYPSSAGYGNPQRAKWGPSGHYGHSQWPNNDHGDPGLTKIELWGATPTNPVEEDVNLPVVKANDVGHPKALKLLRELIDLVQPGRDTSTTALLDKAIHDFQAFFNVPGGADGIVGSATWKALLEVATKQ
jgi:hypothetical protein